MNCLLRLRLRNVVFGGRFFDRYGCFRSFFNREKEVEGIKEQLLDPKMLVVTGPVNSGKSAVLNKLLDDVQNSNVPVMKLNLRLKSFLDTNDFVNVLLRTFSPWYQQVDAVKVKGLSLEFKDVHLSLGERLSATLESIVEVLPELVSCTVNSIPFCSSTKPIFCQPS